MADLTNEEFEDEAPRLIDIAEFCRLGYLQELNRRFLHPLGMALQVTVEDDGTETLSGIWDYRDDPEGISYRGIELATNANRVDATWRDRARRRFEALGYIIQPPSP